MRHLGDDLADLDAALCADIEAVAEALLGPANRKLSSRKHLAFGNNGSLKVAISGNDRGLWYDHELKRGGGPLGLISCKLPCDFSDAIIWARNRTGQSEGASYTAPLRRIPNAEPGFDADDLAARDEARLWWQQAVPIEGTLGERYLVETRKIPAPPDGWPSTTIRYHAGRRWIIFAGSLSDGTVQCVQYVRLNARGQKMADNWPAKLSRGPQAGAYMRLPGDRSGPLQTAEGPESGTTVWRATLYETWIAFGSMGKITPPTGRPVIACADDDHRMPAPGKPNTSYVALQKAVKQWGRSGANVTLVYPWAVRRQDKSDFNDLAKAEGIEAVRARIECVTNPKAPAINRVTIAEARALLAEAVTGFVECTHAWTPPEPDDHAAAPYPVKAIKVTVGGGKSHAARVGIEQLLTELRAEGDNRNIAIPVPTLKLADEQAQALNLSNSFREAGLVARVARGRAAPDPNAPGKAMCLEPERIKDAQDAMASSIQSACCETTTSDGSKIQCPSFWKCGYQDEKRQTADAWFHAHELIYSEKPKHFGELAAVVVDESAWQDGLKGTNPKEPITLSLHSLTADSDVPGDPQASQRLRFLRLRLADALTRALDGPLLREMILATDLTSQSAVEARGLEWRRKVPVEIHPAMTKEQRKEAVTAAAVNKTIPRLSMLWDAVAALLAPNGPEASGWARLGEESTDIGPVRAVRLIGRQKIRDGWKRPTLVLDAVLQPELIRHMWPQVEVIADIAVAAPHEYVLQATDKTYSKAMMTLWNVERQKADPEGAKTHARAVARNLKKIHAQVTMWGRAVAPKGVLLVMQKEPKEALLALGALPSNVSTAHHNAVAGRDEWKDIRLNVIIGRTEAPAEAVSTIASAVTGEHVPEIDWYQREDAIREMANGAIMSDANRHPHPIGEAVRYSICEAELVQIRGRGRGVNRTAANPLTTLVMTDNPLPFPVDELLSADDLALTLAETQLAAGGAAFAIPAHALLAHPTLWKGRDGQPSLGAARKAFQREADEIQTATFSSRYLPIRECPTLETWRYQIAGPRQHPSIVRVDRSVVADPTAHIAKVLKATLAVCELVEAEPADSAAIAETTQKGLPPAAFYGRGVLEPPPETMLTLRSRHNRKIVLAEIEVPAMGPLFSISPLMPWGYGPPLLSRRPGFSVRDLPHLICHRPPEAAGMRM